MKKLTFNFLPDRLVMTCHVLITIVNSLDQDLARQNVGLDLDPTFLTL